MNVAVIDQVYVDELVRENARLTIRHTADHQRILALCDQVELLEKENKILSERAEQAERDLSLAAEGMKQEKDLAAKLDQAIKDLHFVMADDGDACKVCGKKCLMGTDGVCEPRWKGLDD